MQHSAFKIYNASAGSGKTYTLAKSYIKLLVASNNNDAFKYILALTFTNKAVGEMKTRIVDMLKIFAAKKNTEAPLPMFQDICKELDITPTYLSTKSATVLKHIIHNYGAFDISTIDGFTHRVIRTFAHDLKLSVNFEVDLDQESLLSEAVDRLIAKAGTDKVLTKTLVDFAIEKTDDDKSWDISFDFNKIAKLLVKENDILEINKLKAKSFEDFKGLKLLLISKISEAENSIVKISETVLALIEESGLEYSNFSNSFLPKYFDNLSQKNTNVRFDLSWQNKLLEGGQLYPKRVTPDVASTIESIQSQFLASFIATKDLVFQLKLNKALYKNITSLSVLNAIRNELTGIKNEQNKLLISEFNTIISNEIKDQPTPFIYERLGEKFKHYFIDEFQDTSIMQWQNLVPLLDNGLAASNGSTMLVGDAKQAIYRWRGGDAEQFMDLYNKTDKPFQVEPNVLALDTNYRSAREIISFNNSFFDFLSHTYFKNPVYADLYISSNQKPHNKTQGYVNLNFLDLEKDDDDSELYTHEVLEVINKSRANGYQLDDICILVRKHNHGVAIANYLTEHGIKITSSETLLLKNSPKVCFINTVLKLLVQPNNEELNVEFLSYLALHFKIEDKHLFYTTHLKETLSETLESLKSLELYIDKNHLLQLPLYDLAEALIRIFNFNTATDAYLLFYLDTVLEFTQKQNSDLSAFITYFEKKQDKLSIVSSKANNAVEIMTIHKSKGLEFPVVIFPFADLNIYKEIEPKAWFPLEKDAYNGFETLLINYNSEVAHFGAYGKDIHNTRQSQLRLDNINLLYVVLTRAVDQLYVISKKDIDAKGIAKENSYSGMLIAHLQHLGLWTDNQLTYSFGEQELKLKSEHSDISILPLNFISTPKENHSLSLVTNSGLLWDTQQEKAIERGNLVHLILSKITTTDDIDSAFYSLLETGDINNTQIDALKLLVTSVVTHPKLSVYFKAEFNVHNECDIITPTGEILRPDRLNINSNNEIIIMDYKTGEQAPSHELQLRNYETVLNEMSFKVIQKLLVYIDDNIIVIEA